MRRDKPIIAIMATSPVCRTSNCGVMEDGCVRDFPRNLIALSEDMGMVNQYIDQFHKYLDGNYTVEVLKMTPERYEELEAYALIQFTEYIVLRKFECLYYMPILESLYSDVKSATAVLYLANKLFDFDIKKLDCIYQAFNLIYDHCLTWEGFLDNLSDDYLLEDVFINPLAIEDVMITAAQLDRRYDSFIDKIESDFGGDDEC